MDYLALEVGRIVIGLAFLAALIWMVSVSPLLYWLGRVLVLAGWGVLSVGSVLFVIFVIYLPQDRYGAALAAVVVGAIMYVPWFIIGLPELKKCFVGKHDRRLVARR